MAEFKGTPNGEGRRIAVIVSRFNEEVTAKLLEGAVECLIRHGVRFQDVDVHWVPGAWEVPLAAMPLARSGRYDAIVGLGAVMRGATYHFEVISNQSAAGLMRVANDTGVVVTNGIITVDTMDQALERAGSKLGNKGADAALAALATVTAIRSATA